MDASPKNLSTWWAWLAITRSLRVTPFRHLQKVRLNVFDKTRCLIEWLDCKKALAELSFAEKRITKLELRVAKERERRRALLMLVIASRIKGGST